MIDEGFFDRLQGYLPILGSAVLTTIGLAVAIAILASLLGIGLAVITPERGWFRAAINAYIHVGRAIPVLVQLFAWYYVLPQFGIVLPATVAGVLAISFAYCPYLAEVFRAGILAVEVGQREAAQVLGLSRWRTWWRVILPQAIRNVLPIWTSYLVSIFKDTSLFSFIAVPELFGAAKAIAALNFRYFELFAIVTVVYLMLGLPVIALLRRVERRLDRGQSRLHRRSPRLAGLIRGARR
ncbi:MAG: amino acid ABC transporter permease [Microbacteriaceae bacterium]|nr:amino acid ABC transporter permease [Microbacteriaceae bacterium]